MEGAAISFVDRDRVWFKSITGGGLQVGALCVFDSRPRELGADELQFLRDMAETVIRELQTSIFR